MPIGREERRETWLIKFGRKGARAALRFCIRAGEGRKEGKEGTEGSGYLQSQVLGGYEQ